MNFNFNEVADRVLAGFHGARARALSILSLALVNRKGDVILDVSRMTSAADIAAAIGAAGGVLAEAKANKGAANGYAPLDGNSQVPLPNLPLDSWTKFTDSNGSLRKTKAKIYNIRKGAGVNTLTIAMFGDSVACEHLDAFGETQLAKELGFVGTFLAAGGRSGSSQWEYTSTDGALQNDQFALWPAGWLLKVSAGQHWAAGIEYRNFGGGGLTTYPLAQRTTDTFKIVYVKSIGAGTFKVQARNNRNTNDYSDVSGLTSVDASLTSGSPTYGVATVTMPVGIGNEFNVVGLSGDVQFIGAKMYDSTKSGVIFADIARGGIEMEGNNDPDPTHPSGPANSASSAILSGVLTNVIQPDLITWSMKDSLYGNSATTPIPEVPLATALANFWTLWNGAYPGADWIFVNPSPDVEGAGGFTNYAQRTVIAQFCQANSVGFFDSNKYFRTWQEVENAGWHLNSPHLNSLGTAQLSEHFLHDFHLLSNEIGRSGRDAFSEILTGYNQVRWGEINLGNLALGARDALFANRGIMVGASSQLLTTTTAMTSVGTGDFTVGFVVDLNNWPPGGAAFALSGGTAFGNVASLLSFGRFTGTRFTLTLRDSTNSSQRIRYFDIALIDATKRVYFTVRRASGIITVKANGIPLTVPFGDTLSGATPPVFSDTVNSSYFGLWPSSAWIYETVMWPSALTNAQELSYYETSVAPAGSALLWKFGEQSGNQTLDYSGNGRTGSINTSGTWTWLSPKLSALNLGTATTATLRAGDTWYPNNASRVTGTLPATPALNDEVRVVGLGAGGWKVAQPANTQIVTGAGGTIGTNATTVGTAGYIQSGARYDGVTLRCIVSDSVTPSYIWKVAGDGTLTWN